MGAAAAVVVVLGALAAVSAKLEGCTAGARSEAAAPAAVVMVVAWAASRAVSAVPVVVRAAAERVRESSSGKRWDFQLTPRWGPTPS